MQCMSENRALFKDVGGGGAVSSNIPIFLSSFGQRLDKGVNSYSNREIAKVTVILTLEENLYLYHTFTFI